MGKIQSPKAPPQQTFRGPFQMTSHIITNHGVSTLFRGWYATCWREVPAFGLYFGCYDMFKESITEQFFDVDHPHIWTASAAAGGLSGMLTWALVYPMDVVKTKIQTSPFDSTRLEDRKILYATKSILREKGVRTMFRGLGVTLARAFPVNGIIFPVYEFTLSQLRR